MSYSASHRRGASYSRESSLLRDHPLPSERINFVQHGGLPTRSQCLVMTLMIAASWAIMLIAGVFIHRAWTDYHAPAPQFRIDPMDLRPESAFPLPEPSPTPVNHV